MTQSKIPFKGAAAIPAIITTNAIEEQEQEINIEIENDSKRQRTNHEMEDGELREDLHLPSAGSDMLSVDSFDTIINGPPRESLPAQITKTNNQHFLTAEEIDIKAIKLERLRDKSDRYSSHIEFLTECRDTNVIPKGLRIDMLPTIGNNDDAFCAKWFDTLQGFSITLMNQIIEYSEKIETDTAKKIEEETKTLKSILNEEGFQEMTTTMDNLCINRKKRLAAGKKKKYFHLRYNREQSRPERPTQNSDRERPTRESHRSDRRDYQNISPQRWDFLKSGRRDRTEGVPSNPRDQHLPSSSRYYTDETHQPSRHASREQESDTHFDRPERRRIDTQRDRHSEYQQRDFNPRRPRPERHNQYEQSSNHTPLGHRNTSRGDHAQIAPAQKRTFADILTRNSRPNSRGGSFTNLSRQPSSHARGSQQNDHRDNELRELRDRLSRYEQNQPPKNVPTPQARGDTPSTSANQKKPSNKEVIDFISKTMLSLQNYKEQLEN